jgi:Family of unknown function (DUF5995)
MMIFDEQARDGVRTISGIIGPMRGFDPEVAGALKDALARIDTVPKSIAAADEAQTRLLAVFEAHQHRAAAFLKVYHGITVAVNQALHQGRLTPRFFFERLPGKFAERHFDGVKVELGLDTTSDAARYALWRPSFGFDNMTPVPDAPLAAKPPLAHFLVGMCCHINLDLAVALDETIRELGQGDARLLEEIERGHNFVDSILEEQVGRSIGMLAAELGCEVSKLILAAGAVAMVAEQSMATIRRWRGKTFPNAMRLCAAASDEERDRVRAEIYRDGARKTVRLFNAMPGLMQTMASGKWMPQAVSG